MDSESSIGIAYDCAYPHSKGGGERQYGAFARDLARRGIRVTYLTARQWDGPTPDNEDYKVEAVSGRLRLYDDQGVRRFPAAVVFAWALFRSLIRHRNDFSAVIVSGLPVLNVLAARAALLGSGTRLVIDYLEVWGRKQWLEYAGRMVGSVAWTLQRMAVRVTPIATAHSALTANRLRREGLRGRLLVSPGLIERPTKTVGFHDRAEQPPYVIYAGRHIPDKRVEALPAAVAEARKTIPNLKLIILGAGPSNDLVRGQVQAVDGSTWIELPGFVSEEKLDALMGGAACLVNPSRREGDGLVVVESAAHGTPVVLVRDQGNASTELLVTGTNGFVADTALPADLGAAIVSAIEGGTALRVRTREWYDKAIRTKTIERTMDQLLVAIGAWNGIDENTVAAERNGDAQETGDGCQ